MAYAFCACVAGCAAPGTSSPAATISVQDARDAAAVGKSTKAGVLAALGKATVISFDSGFEVWAYQYKSEAPGKNEFVILFAPSGVVAKTRVRPAPPPVRSATK